MRIVRECIEAVRLLSDGADSAVAWRFAWTATLSLIGGALASVAPLALKELVDILHANAAAPTGTVGPVVTSVAASGLPDPVSWVALLAGAYLACHCLARVIAEIRPLLMSEAEQRLYSGLRVRYFGHLLDLPLEFHLSGRAGARMQELQQANAGYQVILFHVVNSIVPVVVEALGVMLVLISLRQPGLSVTVAVTALAYLFVMSRGMPELRSAATAVTATGADVQAMLAEGLTHVEPIKVFGAERATLARFGQASLSLQQAWRTLQRLRMHRGIVIVVVFAGSMTASLALSTCGVLDGTLSVGGFVLANLYMMQVIRPLEAMSGAVRDVGQALAFIRPLIDTMNVAVDVHPHKAFGEDLAPGPAGVTASEAIRNPTPLRRSPQLESLNSWPVQPQLAPRVAPQLAFCDVHLSFDDRRPVLRGVDLRIPAGQATAIVGTSGCGKSSLVRLLLRLQEPQRGSILVDGIPIQALPVDRLRAMVAVVPQDVVLFNTTIGLNIGFGHAQASPSDIARAAASAGLHDFILSLIHI